MKRVILSTSLIIGSGSFQAQEITEEAALAWLEVGPVENYCRHETVRLLGFDPKSAFPQCAGYDEALCLGAKNRLEFGREYSLEEIRAVGVCFTLVKHTPSLDNILALAAQVITGLDDPKAADKLLAERDELMKALAEGDVTGALTELADAGYYAAKHLDWAARRVTEKLGYMLTVENVLRLTVAKYRLRAVDGKPKDDVAERAACLAALGLEGWCQI